MTCLKQFNFVKTIYYYSQDRLYVQTQPLNIWAKDFNIP